MSKNSENTQFQNATASTLKAISGNMIEEREIKFSGSTGYLSSKEVRLPIISKELDDTCLLYTSPSPRDMRRSRMPSSA